MNARELAKRLIDLHDLDTDVKIRLVQRDEYDCVMKECVLDIDYFYQYFTEFPSLCVTVRDLEWVDV